MIDVYTDRYLCIYIIAELGFSYLGAHKKLHDTQCRKFSQQTYIYPWSHVLVTYHTKFMSHL